MTWRRSYLSLALALTLSLIALGCGSDSTGPEDPGPAPEDFSGNWDLDFEVVAKRTCSRDIGDMDNSPVVITQDGRRATIIIDNIHRVELTVTGSNATGSSTGAVAFDVALTIAEGELGGTISFTDSSVPCTEVVSIVGTRTNAAPSTDFEGNWDLNITVTSSECDGETVGAMEQVCRAISVDGNTVSLADEDGPISGVGDGITTILTRIEPDGFLEVTLTVSGNSLSGGVRFFDTEDQCEVISTLVGTKRTEPCPSSPPQDGFEGSWDMLIRVSASNCADEEVGDSFGACMTASVDGSNISLDDGSSEGPLTGTIDGNTLMVSRTSNSGVLTVTGEIDGDEIFGVATMNYTSGSCAGTQVEYSVDGLKRTSPCGSGAGGSFEGFWNLDGEFISNTCNAIIRPTCSQFLQSGNTVSIVEDGLQGTVSGNTLTIHQEETLGTANVTIDIVMVIAGDENSFTGTQTFTVEDEVNSENNCEFVASISGTRTSSCNSNSAGILISLPEGDR